MERKSRGQPAVVLLAGPTASGKSRLALEFAAARDAIVVNADSMQVYRDLRVLTARPSPEDERIATHRLYGHVDAATRYSVGAWLADFAAVLSEVAREGRPLVAVGGTGLYFKALTEGLTAIPPIPPEVRAALLADSADTTELHERLGASDPEGAATIRPSDRARVVRALEVVLGTGRPITAWRRSAAQRPLLHAVHARKIVLMPERGELARRIAARTATMLAGGALGEVSLLLARNLPRDHPAMKAIGVRELGDHLAGKMPLDEAAVAINLQTRHYAKRQRTWFRNQMGDWERSEGPLDLAG